MLRVELLLERRVDGKLPASGNMEHGTTLGFTAREGDLHQQQRADMHVFLTSRSPFKQAKARVQNADARLALEAASLLDQPFRHPRELVGQHQCLDISVRVAAIGMRLVGQDIAWRDAVRLRVDGEGRRVLRLATGKPQMPPKAILKGTLGLHLKLGIVRRRGIQALEVFAERLVLLARKMQCVEKLVCLLVRKKLLEGRQGQELEIVAAHEAAEDDLRDLVDNAQDIRLRRELDMVQGVLAREVQQPLAKLDQPARDMLDDLGVAKILSPALVLVVHLVLRGANRNLPARPRYIDLYEKISDLKIALLDRLLFFATVSAVLLHISGRDQTPVAIALPTFPGPPDAGVSGLS